LNLFELDPILAILCFLRLLKSLIVAQVFRSRIIYQFHSIIIKIDERKKKGINWFLRVRKVLNLLDLLNSLKDFRVHFYKLRFDENFLHSIEFLDFFQLFDFRNLEVFHLKFESFLDKFKNSFFFFDKRTLIHLIYFLKNSF
jgi:hypothetical protein